VAEDIQRSQAVGDSNQAVGVLGDNSQAVGVAGSTLVAEEGMAAAERMPSVKKFHVKKSLTTDDTNETSQF